MRYIRTFVAFWYDFIIGDRPELFVGSIAILAVVGLAIQAGLAPEVAGLVLALLLLALEAASVMRGVGIKPPRQ